MANISSVAKSAQNASEIGWAFVPQYYTFVNKDPSRLHCFYTKRSTLIHSTEGEEATPCFGQQEIHDKFMSLNFDDCKVFVSNVDSQSSADGGIIVQVLGEMSNGAGPWRKFAQTFFLAEQPNGFFVLNDIFRYIKEEVEEGDDEPEAEPVTVTEDVPSSEHSLILSNTDALPPAYQPESSSTPLPAAPVETKPVASTSPAQNNPSFAASSAGPTPSAEPVAGTQSLGPSKVNGFHPDQVDVKPPEAPIEPVAASESSPPAAAAATPSASASPAAGPSSTLAQANTNNVEKTDVGTTSLPTPAQPSASSQAPSANGRSASGQSKSAPIPASVATQTKPVEATPPPAPAPSVPKTWASLAASGKSAWGQGHLAASQGVSTAPSALSQSGVESSSQTPQQRPAAASHTNPGWLTYHYLDRLNVDSVSTGACFIKSVHENLDEKSLKDQLTKRFGPIKDLDVIRTKACGFLEFQSIESAKKAIQMSLPFNLGGKGGISINSNGEEFMIVIESKRQPGERGRPIDAGPKRGFGGGNGGGGGGGGGGERGGRSGGGGGGGGGGSGNFGARGGRGGMEGPRGAGRGGRGGGGGGGGGNNNNNSRGISHPK
ncbi:uncharacterized protein MELLADRAFT_76555 [Melampsora larici-populina 98AG31]|uniref:NTF2 domain-containing protein n=1 Tax=Melampsora larici-populina (strain 98AG31 / pathotype 3-4-7) TaxID=747676 RepID=F4R5K7_MELLP|nr:uncharacterized protein MELLADRAFT_76555 [Melampsora larici-populina 98AG31]EGG12063.1 hypothetical protein MELLADRAFT_76555 [Melampsora larici-populina 98AG31]